MSSSPRTSMGMECARRWVWHCHREERGGCAHPVVRFRTCRCGDRCEMAPYVGLRDEAICDEPCRSKVVTMGTSPRMLRISVRTCLRDRLQFHQPLRREAMSIPSAGACCECCEQFVMSLLRSASATGPPDTDDAE